MREALVVLFDIYFAYKECIGMPQGLLYYLCKEKKNISNTTHRLHVIKHVFNEYELQSKLSDN